MQCQQEAPNFEFQSNRDSGKHFILILAFILLLFLSFVKHPLIENIKSIKHGKEIK